MVNHKKVYLKELGLTDTDFIACEVCQHLNRHKRACDIHHIIPRGMGGSKERDYIENLMAVCRDCHNDCENNGYSKELQTKIHFKFIGRWAV